MPYKYANPNPKGARVGDCVIRAISIATGKTWESVYAELSFYGFRSCDMPSSNAVWGKYLRDLGFKQYIADDTVREFCRDHSSGTYIVGTGSHAVAVIDGNYYDTWDSGDEAIIIFWGE